MTQLKACSIEGCQDQRFAARGMCWRHYRQWLRTGDPIAVQRPRLSNSCSVEGCEQPYYGGGLCGKHYNRKLRGQGLTTSNNRRRYTEEVHPEPGLTVCRVCRETLTPDKFPQSTTIHNRPTTCLSCGRERARLDREQQPDRTEPDPEKWCPGCLQVLPASEFARQLKSRTGLQTYCRVCHPIVGKHGVSYRREMLGLPTRRIRVARG